MRMLDNKRMNSECSIWGVLIFSVNFAPGYPERYHARRMKLPTYSIGTLLLLTVVAAIAIPALLYPGAYLVYLPALAILLTAIALVRSVRQFPKRRIQSIGLTVLLALFVFGFISLFDIAAEQYRQTSLFTEQFQRVVSLDDPKSFRSKSLVLHSQLIAKNVDQRTISGDSDLIPLEIRQVKPVSIVASENYLTINMTPSGESQIVIYPPNSQFPRVSSFKIIDDFYYWGRQK